MDIPAIVENIALPTRSMPKIERVPMPGRNKRKVSPSLRKAAREYKQAYKSLYHMNPVLTFDGTWVRIHGRDEGVSIKRLKELTAQIKNRIG